MKIFRKFLLLLGLTLALSVTAFAAEVTSTTATIGGATAKVVYITLSDTTVVAPVVANGSVGTDAAASSIVSGAPGKVVAALNGNFFNSYYDKSKPMDINTGNYARTFGAIINDGKMICSGGTAAIGFGYDGSVRIGRVTLKGRVKVGSYTYVAWGVNTIHDASTAVIVLTAELDYPVDIPASSTIVTIRDEKVESITSGYSGYVVPDGAIALVIGGGYHQYPLKVGDKASYDFVAWDSDDNAAWEGMRNILGGSGLIVENGQSAVDSNESLTADDQDPDLVSQRTFAAVLADGRLMFGAVSSSYRKIAQSLIEMGVTDAMMLDGGASSMIYANGSFSVPAGRNLASILAVMDTTVTSGGNTGAAETPSAWAKADVDEARDLGILPGSVDSRYQQSITRGEFCQLVAGYVTAKTGKTMAEFCKSKNLTVNASQFSDTSDSDIASVAALEIVNGYPDGTFRPDQPIQRQDAAIMLRRLAQVFGAAADQEPRTFLDSGSISDYARPGVDFVTALGIMNGHANGNFAPRDNITREQAVITIMNAWRELK